MNTRTIRVDRDVRSESRRRAAQLRGVFSDRGTLVVNMLSSPGAGKTSLLEATARHWAGRWRMAVLVGDLATDRDARRLAPYCPVEQLTTGGACHLEIQLLEEGLQRLALRGDCDPTHLDFLFVENVGNLVCPASHDLAEHVRVVLLSVTEGEDKPGKYPKMFRTSDAMVVTKTDLLPHVPFTVASAAEDARLVQPLMDVLSVSVLTGEGVAAWCRWLEHARDRMLAGALQPQHLVDRRPPAPAGNGASH